ncbi:leucine-rich repeat protein [Trypanosoma theileri]|uniref:Leucine-rich repeat protein n=1 Tax=Trypanosoma theileri TaxID=67003 RepID=A0A1X0NN23_9TRYP|nr:leucine-rich repeat protein [Trypanosoma theileri]ORC86001.1 leucine-rich repeat protein [Trypanosoma theileri]
MPSIGVGPSRPTSLCNSETITANPSTPLPIPTTGNTTNTNTNTTTTTTSTTAAAVVVEKEEEVATTNTTITTTTAATAAAAVVVVEDLCSARNTPSALDSCAFCCLGGVSNSFSSCRRLPCILRGSSQHRAGEGKEEYTTTTGREERGGGGEIGKNEKLQQTSTTPIPTTGTTNNSRIGNTRETTGTGTADIQRRLLKFTSSQSSLSGGIPLARYRAKLEECATLHDQLQNTVSELCMTREQLDSVRSECNMLIAEIVRLRDVLNMNTSELHTQQQRVEELRRENRQLRDERRESPQKPQSLLQSRLPPLPSSSSSYYQSSYPIRPIPIPPITMDVGGSQPVSTAVVQAHQVSFTPTATTNNNNNNNTTMYTDHTLPCRTCPSVHRPTHSAAAVRIGAAAAAAANTNTNTNANIYTQAFVRADTRDVTSAMAAYVCECFRTEVIPHMELLHSLYDGGRLMAVEPSITYAQLSALKRVIIEAKSMTPADFHNDNNNNNNNSKEQPQSQHQGEPSQQRTMSLTQGKKNTYNPVPMSWVHDVGLLSFRSDSWHSSIGLLLYMIRTLPSVREVEVFAISENAVMQKLAETLMMEVHVEVLSLPEMVLTDEGLLALFSLITRREKLSIADAKEAADAATPSIAAFGNSGVSVISQMGESANGTNSSKSPSMVVDAFADAAAALRRASAAAAVERVPLLTLRCLDLSRCTITHPTTLFRGFHSSTLEVLILTGCTALRDVHVRDILEVCPQLHTLDLSGSVGLSNACVTYISQHKRLKVLRLENCPGIKRLELSNIEVLFSSLAYIAKLYAPELRRLPIPLTHANVLYDFFAPKLTEITLKGIIVGRGTLSVFLHNSTSDHVAAGRTSPGIPISNSSLASLESRSQVQFPTSYQYEMGDDVPQLLSVGFIDCVISDSSELKMFLQQQVHLLRLSLHGCRGVMDTQLARLPPTLLELDVGGVAQLTRSSIQAIVTCLPNLVKLSLKKAGNGIDEMAIHQLRALGNLEVLNLLGLPQLRDEVIAAVAEALPKLRILYHETVVVETKAAATAATAAVKPILTTTNTINTNTTATAGGGETLLSFAVLRVERSDEEDNTRKDIHHCTKELLQLRNETALALWMEAQLPKPTTLLPQRPLAKPTEITAVGISHPPLTTNTTYYEATQQILSRQGTRAIGDISREPSIAMVEQDENGLLMLQEKPDVMTFDDVEEKATTPNLSSATATTTTFTPAHREKKNSNGENNNNSNNNEEMDMDDDNDNDGISRESPADTRRAVMENAMDERGRMAIEKAPLGPWDEADIVDEHRRYS